VVFQCDPPASELVALAQKAEAAGFSHVWTFDSHLLWQEPFRHLQPDLANTSRVVVGPMVTNPAPGLDGHRLAVRHAQRHVPAT